MILSILFYIHVILLLGFGVAMSFAFAGVKYSKKTLRIVLAVFAMCGVLQLAVTVAFGAQITQQLYPVITHLPLAIMIGTHFHKRISTVASAIASTYLCCQPSSWLGYVILDLTGSEIASNITEIIALPMIAFIAIRHLIPFMSEIYNKEDTHSIMIFGSIPVLYYIFDYIAFTYADHLSISIETAVEFISFFLCFSFMLMCGLYYREYEQKSDAERKEQILRITAEQQAKEVEAIRRTNLETRIMRHDMRHLLENLMSVIKNDDKETALKIISTYVDQIEAATLHKFCANDTINYILSNYQSKCDDSQVHFDASVETDFFTSNEVSFASILSNALDNALNAQAELPPADRFIRVSIKQSNSKLLLSVMNPLKTVPEFSDGMPRSRKQGHGYGTQSIRYLSESLDGMCQFSMQDNIFITRVII